LLYHKKIQAYIEGSQCFDEPRVKNVFQLMNPYTDSSIISIHRWKCLIKLTLLCPHHLHRTYFCAQCILSHMQMYTNVLTLCILSLMQMYTNVHTHTHVYTQAHKYTRTHRQMHTHTHTHTHICTKHAHTHTHTYTRTRTHACAHTNTRTHTHTLQGGLSLWMHNVGQRRRGSRCVNVCMCECALEPADKLGSQP
jgi:hypothetical protein